MQARQVDLPFRDSPYALASRFHRSITLICHSNGMFSVGCDLGGFNGSEVFRARADADAHAAALQARLGSQDHSRIVVHDLVRTGL